VTGALTCDFTQSCTARNAPLALQTFSANSFRLPDNATDMLDDDVSAPDH
jgi:hypothetical protein